MSFYRNAFGNPVVAEVPGYGNANSLFIDTRYYTSVPELSPDISPQGYYGPEPKSNAGSEQTYWRPQENLVYRTPPASGSITPVEHPGAISPHESSAMRQINEMPHNRESQDSPLECRWAGCTYAGHFARQSTLLRHIRLMHLSPRQYLCPVSAKCKPFNRKDNLVSHIRSVHNMHRYSKDSRSPVDSAYSPSSI